MIFSELKPGNIFRYASDIYIKTETTYDYDNHAISNTVRLKDGEVSYFNDDADVTQLNAKVVIE